MLKLYHGSNVVIDKIDICRSRKGKDFGCGFYLNPDKSQAMDMAIRTYRRSQDLLLNKNAPLSIKIFEEYSVEWAEFVLMNRKNMTTTPVHHYDIVIGPIANDTVGLQMRRFMQGYIDMERMLDELRFHKPAIQYFFGTEKAINYLKKV